MLVLSVALLCALRLARASLSRSAVPSSYAAVETLMAASLLQLAGERAVDPSQRRFSVEVRTPGLNDKLEQSAIVSRELLFDLVARAVLPSLSRRFSALKLMFPSSGDAAGFQAHCRRQGLSFEGVALTDIAADRVEEGDECLVLVGARNSLGDPVLRAVMAITAACPLALCLLVNCDLSDRVTTGMTERTARDAFRATFRPLFYFRNLVSIARPSQIPTERGALVFADGAWRVFAVDDSRMQGPGSLNRFMRTPAFARDPADPSAADPPLFLLAGTFADMPRRDEIDECLSAGAARVERLLARAARAVNSAETALLRLEECASGKGSREDVEDALVYLAAHQSSGGGVEASGEVLAMGLVDLREPADGRRTDFRWSDAALRNLPGRWRRCFGGERSALSMEELHVEAPDGTGGMRLRAGGLLLRTGSLKPLPDRLLALSLAGASFLGVSVSQPAEPDRLQLLLATDDLLALRESSSLGFSLWRKLN